LSERVIAGMRTAQAKATKSALPIGWRPRWKGESRAFSRAARASTRRLVRLMSALPRCGAFGARWGWLALSVQARKAPPREAMIATGEAIAAFRLEYLAWPGTNDQQRR